jgi:hypothetical protein
MARAVVSLDLRGGGGVKKHISVYQFYVGRAFRSRRDGVIRWVTHLSARENYTLLWLDEQSGVWNQGGHVPAATFERFYGGDEVMPPQPGETYKFAGVFGGYREVAA